MGKSSRNKRRAREVRESKARTKATKSIFEMQLRDGSWLRIPRTQMVELGSGIDGWMMDEVTEAKPLVFEDFEGMEKLIFGYDKGLPKVAEDALKGAAKNWADAIDAEAFKLQWDGKQWSKPEESQASSWDEMLSSLTEDRLPEIHSAS